MLEKVFKLKEHGTNVKTEVVAGLTTFLAMAYILAVNPSILGTVMNQNGVFLATAISSAIATFIMALTDNSATMFMFKGCVACTIFVPVVAYVYLCLHRYAMGRSGRKDYYSPGSSAGDNEASDDKQ